MCKGSFAFRGTDTFERIVLQVDPLVSYKLVVLLAVYLVNNLSAAFSTSTPDTRTGAHRHSSRL